MALPSAIEVGAVGLPADVAITKTDGVTTATPGGSVTYTITASNAGPLGVSDGTVMDTFPASLTATWTCVGAGGGTCTASGSGNINDAVNLPAGGSVTYTASATISAAATGAIVNTATVDSGSVLDSNPSNNSATDTDTLSPQADLAITKTDGVTTAVPGGSVTYTITASNAGPSNAPGATVADTFPASLTANWTCVGAGGGTCTAAGSGNINDTVNLPAGGSVTYTASATISAAATGTLSNTATVAAPGGVTDPTPGNNSATDSDTLSAQADLSITKTDGVTSAFPDGSVSYTITASNAGPSNASGATVADTFPASLTALWTCVGSGGGTCAASGSGNILDTVNLPAGGSVTYIANASISAAATGTLSNTATVSAPGGVTDPNPGNNSATDSDTLTPAANLSITKTDGVTTATPGGSVTYTITATSLGGTTAIGATVADTFPASLTASWTCVGAGGGTCTAAGSGNINDTVNLPSGASVTYTATATISAAATGAISNTATVANPVGLTDPDPGNNSATDTDVLAPSADLSITKTDGVTTAAPGGSVTYTITASNAGPSNVTAQVADTFPASLTAAWTCVGAGGASCDASGSGSIADLVDLPAGGSVTYTAIATISPIATGTLSNTATVLATADDPNPGNNSATDTDMLQPVTTLTLTKTAPTHAVAGGTIDYTITVGNTGPSPANTVNLSDTLPTGTTFVSMTQTSGLTAAVTTPAVGATGTVTATFSNMTAGTSATFTLTVQVGPTILGGTVITNTATADTTEISGSVAGGGPGPVSVTASAVTTIDPTSELSLTKQLQGTLIAGTNANYTLTLHNNGPDATSTTITLTDNLPAALDYVSASGTGWTCAAVAQTVTCTRDTPLANAASTTVTVTVHVHADATGTIINQATVTGVASDAVPSNDVSSAAGAVTPPPATTAPTTTTTVPATTAPTTTVAHGALPATGSDSSGLVRLAVILTALGLTAIAVTATRRRPRTN